MTTLTHAEFLSAKRFPALDGLRALAATMVVLFHFGGPDVLQGWIGVHLFFVLSGFLITTLLLRERQRSGRVSLPEFYLRRAFRILPVYLVVLGMVVLGSLAAGTFVSSGVSAALPFHLTLLNEFAGNNPFGQSWTLGIEQKFYLFWPLLLVTGAASTARQWGVTAAGLVLALGLLPATLGQANPNWSLGYFSILVGCLVAVAMHHPRGFAVVRPLTRPAVTVCVGVAFVAWHFSLSTVARSLDEWSGVPGHIVVTPVYALACAVLLPAVVANGPVQRFLSTRPMVFVGERSYSLYLVQNIAGLAVAGVVATGFAHMVLVYAVALVMAHALYRLVEQPMIAVGRRVVQRRRDRSAAGLSSRADSAPAVRPAR